MTTRTGEYHDAVIEAGSYLHRRQLMQPQLPWFCALTSLRYTCINTRTHLSGRGVQSAYRRLHGAAPTLEQLGCPRQQKPASHTQALQAPGTGNMCVACNALGYARLGEKLQIIIGNKYVSIQLARCWFPGLAISNAII